MKNFKFVHINLTKFHATNLKILDCLGHRKNNFFIIKTIPYEAANRFIEKFKNEIKDYRVFIEKKLF